MVDNFNPPSETTLNVISTNLRYYGTWFSSKGLSTKWALKILLVDVKKTTKNCSFLQQIQHT